MSAERGNASILGVGAAACVVCCAGPIVGMLAAIGVGTATGYLLVGTVAVFVGVIGVAILLATRRREQQRQCSVVETVPVTAAPTDSAQVQS